MKQKDPKSKSDLLAACQVAAVGAAAIGPTIQLVHTTAEVITEAIDGVLTSSDNYDTAKVTLTSNRSVVTSVSTTARDFLRISRETLKKRLGNKYSAAWDITGFVGSLAIPQSPATLQVRLQGMQRYLAANTDAQADVVEVTAARAESLFNDLKNANAALASQKGTVKELLETRDTAIVELRKTFRSLIKELSQLLDPLDPRWLKFGLNIPGLEQTPAVPENVVVVSHVAGRIEMNWPKVERAASFHIWERVVGPEREDFVLVGSPTDRQFTKSGLTSGTRMELCVSALNTGGESARSAIVVVNVA